MNGPYISCRYIGTYLVTDLDREPRLPGSIQCSHLGSFSITCYHRRGLA